MNTRPTIQSLESDIYSILKSYYDTVMAYQTARSKGVSTDTNRCLNTLEEQEKDAKFAIDKYCRLRHWDTAVDCIWFTEREGLVIKFFKPLPNGKTTYKRRVF